ncbi:hypothetical protein AB1L88_26930, partial [Tautonia sp. JC769]|uniref:DUF7716 domain-containing protein n=1 Tax=Tautonia sp. JC769 TaxID=3232135 RepID=UPI00345B2A1C
TLREVLETVDASPDDAALFLPPNDVWSLDTPCAVLEVDPYDDSESPPPFAQQHGLSYALNVPQVQDIVSNVRQQVAAPSPEQVLAAFLFYYDRDAFIDFGGRDA